MCVCRQLRWVCRLSSDRPVHLRRSVKYIYKYIHTPRLSALLQHPRVCVLEVSKTPSQITVCRWTSSFARPGRAKAAPLGTHCLRLPLMQDLPLLSGHWQRSRVGSGLVWSAGRIHHRTLHAMNYEYFFIIRCMLIKKVNGVICLNFYAWILQWLK